MKRTLGVLCLCAAIVVLSSAEAPRGAEHPPSGSSNKFHRPLAVKDLPGLSLEAIDYFWQEGKPQRTTKYMGANFEDHPGFLGGVRLWGGKIKYIGVSVFRSQDIAISAMEKRRKNVAAVIVPGRKHDLLSGKWWYTSGGAGVFLSHRNVIIEVGCLVRVYEERAPVLVRAAAEVAGRIDATTMTTAGIHALIEALAIRDDGGGRREFALLVKIGKPAIPHLARALADPRKDVRWHSVQALGAIGGAEVVPPLLRALKDEDKDVRRYAAAFLGRWGAGRKDVLEALDKVLYDPNREVVWHAMWALDRLGAADHYKGDVGLVDALCPELDDPDEDRAIYAAQALGMVGSSRACGPLVEALRYPNASGSYRNSIRHALEKIDSREAVPLLLDLFTSDKEERDVRRCAASTLGRLADPSINQRVLPLTKSPESWLRGAVVVALDFKGNVEAVARLMAIAQDEKEEDGVRESAVTALGRIGDPRAVPAVERALTAKDSNLARSAAAALGELGSPKAVPALIRALEDRRAPVVKHAAGALGRIGDRKPLSALVRLFDRRDALEATASFARFANIATVAHFALVRITKEDPTGKNIEMVTEANLDQVRKAWRAKLVPPAARPRP